MQFFKIPKTKQKITHTHNKNINIPGVYLSPKCIHFHSHLCWALFLALEWNLIKIVCVQIGDVNNYRQYHTVKPSIFYLRLNHSNEIYMKMVLLLHLHEPFFFSSKLSLFQNSIEIFSYYTFILYIPKKKKNFMNRSNNNKNANFKYFFLPVYK